MNDLFKRFGSMMPGPMGNMMNMMSQFQKFRQSFNGNPQQQVQELLRSGKMSQEQFDQLSAMAKQMQGMMK